MTAEERQREIVRAARAHRLGRRHRARRRTGRGQGDRPARSAHPGGPRSGAPYPRRRLPGGERRLRDDARLPDHQPRAREAPDRGRRRRAARRRRDGLRRRGLHPAAHRRGAAPGPAADRGHRLPGRRAARSPTPRTSPCCCSAAGSAPAPWPPSTTGRPRCSPASSSTWRSSAPTASPASTASPPPTRRSARSRHRPCAAARRTVFAGVHTKFGAVSFCRFADVGDFEAIVTDTGCSRRPRRTATPCWARRSSGSDTRTSRRHSPPRQAA